MMETLQDFWVDKDLESDHRAIIATSQPLTHEKPKKKILLYHKADWTAINNSITNEMTTLHLDHTSSTEAIDNYTSTLTSVIQTTIIQKHTTNRSQNTFHRHRQDNTRPNNRKKTTKKTMAKNENTTLQNGI